MDRGEVNHGETPRPYFVIVPIKAGALLIVLLYVAMQLKGLDTAFALDEHFRQAGFQVLP